MLHKDPGYPAQGQAVLCLAVILTRRYLCSKTITCMQTIRNTTFKTCWKTKVKMRMNKKTLRSISISQKLSTSNHPTNIETRSRTTSTISMVWARKRRMSNWIWSEMPISGWPKVSQWQLIISYPQPSNATSKLCCSTWTTMLPCIT